MKISYFTCYIDCDTKHIMSFPQQPTTTRIADLPDTTTQQQQMSSSPTTYTPINIHPNPYGNNSVVLPPAPPMQSGQNRDDFFQQQQQPQQTHQTLTHEQQMMLQTMPTQKLPSRDIRMDGGNYMQDEQIKPNYIPQSNVEDYITTDENHCKKERKQHASAKHRQSMIDKLAEELQTPFFMAVLFMLFQLHSLDKWLRSKMHFMNLFGEDGVLNVNGMLFKSFLFGTACYVYTLLQTQFFI